MQTRNGWKEEFPFPEDTFNNYYNYALTYVMKKIKDHKGVISQEQGIELMKQALWDTVSGHSFVIMHPHFLCFRIKSRIRSRMSKLAKTILAERETQNATPQESAS